MCLDVKYVYIHQIMFVFFSSAYKAAYSWSQWIRIYVKIIVVVTLLSLLFFVTHLPHLFFSPSSTAIAIYVLLHL